MPQYYHFSTVIDTIMVSGSDSNLAELVKWTDGKFKHRRTRTGKLIASLTTNTDLELSVRPGDYVTRSEQEGFSVVSGTEFGKMYKPLWIDGSKKVTFQTIIELCRTLGIYLNVMGVIDAKKGKPGRKPRTVL